MGEPPQTLQPICLDYAEHLQQDGRREPTPKSCCLSSVLGRGTHGPMFTHTSHIFTNKLKKYI